MPPRPELSTRAAPLTCSVCSATCSPDEAWTCPECGTGIHEACQLWIGGCSRYACPEAATVARRMSRYLEARLHDIRLATRLEVLIFGIIGIGQAARGHVIPCIALVTLAACLLADARHKQQLMGLHHQDPSTEGTLVALLSELPPTRIPWALRRGGVLAGLTLQLLLIPFCLLTMALLLRSLLPASDGGLALIELAVAWYALWKLLGRALLVTSRSDQLALDWKEEVEEALERSRLTEHCRCPATDRQVRPGSSGAIGLIEHQL